MAKREFDLEIITPERVIYSDKAVSVSVNAEDGRLGILYDHRPLVSRLKIAPLSFVKNNEMSETVAISGSGYLEVTPQKVTVLCQNAELASEIDLERAREAKERAEQRLQQQNESVDYTRAEASLKRAISRINVVNGNNEDED